MVPSFRGGGGGGGAGTADSEAIVQKRMGPDD